MHQRNDIQLQLGDCLTLMQAMQSGTVDLAYLDPPFFTQKTHRLSPRDRSTEFSFEDIWTTQEEYAEFLLARLLEIHRLIADHGSVFFHCDHNASHLARFLLDKVFGAENFRAEVIWVYRRWSNSRRGLLPAHQTIYYYTKSTSYIFNQAWTEYSPATNVDQILQRRSRDDSNKAVYQRDKFGNVVPNGVKRGVPLSDVWDIPFLNPKAKERTGYPTQKPLLLLDRILALATKDGDCILDPFCGSGTTLVAAQSMNRAAVGMDVSPDAIELTKNRLRSPIRSRSRLSEVGRESYRNADPSIHAILQGVDYVPVHRNAGIDGILKEDIDGTPITIRVQRPGETIPEAAQKLYSASADKGAKVMLLVSVAKGGHFPFANQLPVEVMVIDSPAITIRDYLQKLKAPSTVFGNSSPQSEERQSWAVTSPSRHE